jgi:hypothetical protein
LTSVAPAQTATPSAPPTATPQKPAAQPTPQTPADVPLDASPDDPLLGVPPLPKGDLTLVGGTVTGVDRVRNRVSVQPFGGGPRMKMNFDERTHIYRDGTETTQLGIRKGDRVYLDTMLVDGRVFAKSIKVVTHAGSADARGQLVAYDAGSGRITVREELTRQEVTLRLDPDTAVRRGNQPASAADLVPGSLVSVQFASGHGRQGVARQVNIVAVPGTSFTFAGKITHLDLRTGVLALHNDSDNRVYEIRFSPAMPAARDLGVGTDVTLSALFDGTSYTANSMTVNRAKLE